jgi:hypothetical protein
MAFNQISPSELLSHQRAFDLLSADLLKIFEYIEPSEANARTFGHQIYQLFIRISTEFEAVCKLAMRRQSRVNKTKKNGKAIDWRITDYATLNDDSGEWKRDSCTNLPTGKLSDYKFEFIHWGGDDITPLLNFDSPLKHGRSPDFYTAYNLVKHNRSECFVEANLENLLTSFAALICILDWQGITFSKQILRSSDNLEGVGDRFGFFYLTDKTEIKNRFYF